VGPDGALLDLPAIREPVDRDRPRAEVRLDLPGLRIDLEERVVDHPAHGLGRGVVHEEWRERLRVPEGPFDEPSAPYRRDRRLARARLRAGRRLLLASDAGDHREYQRASASHTTSR